MRQLELRQFGVDHLAVVDAEAGRPGPGEVLVQMEAAALNPRDLQIMGGHFSPNVPFPLVPFSDGAGIVEEVGSGVSRVSVGDRVTPMFFPNWISGEATRGERAISLGLEAPGVGREYGVFPESAVCRAAAHLSAQEAACYPCAGLTAWTSIKNRSAIGAGDWVLVQGTGGVATMGIQFAKALGAKVIVISSSGKKLAQAKKLGADVAINYLETPQWGETAFAIAENGVDAVLEIGGSGTLPQSLDAIRHGGHINIIGYVAGAELGLTVFPLIIKNANFHGIGTGNRDSFEAMMDCVAEHQLRPAIAQSFPFEEARRACAVLETESPFGKITLQMSADG